MTKACPEDEGKTSYELGWQVKVMSKTKNIKTYWYGPNSLFLGWGVVFFSCYDVYVRTRRFVFVFYGHYNRVIVLEHRGHRRPLVCPTSRRGGVRFGTTI